MKALDKKIINQIEFILNGIKKGELEHVQREFHCGTAHCIAGWHEYFQKVSSGYEYDEDFSEFRLNNELLEREWPSAWDIAKADWELTRNEAYILFDQDSTLEEIFKLFEWLKIGRRVPDLIFEGTPMPVDFKGLTPVFCLFEAATTLEEKEEALQIYNELNEFIKFLTRNNINA